MALLLFRRGAEATMTVAVGLVRGDLVSIHRFLSFAEEVTGEAAFCPVWTPARLGQLWPPLSLLKSRKYTLCPIHPIPAIPFH